MDDAQMAEEFKQWCEAISQVVMATSTHIVELEERIEDLEDELYENE